MSIKKLFDSNKQNVVLQKTSLEQEVVENSPELESAANVREQIKRVNRFVPQFDFSKPKNFVTYGSAKSYYEDSVSRITGEYPYDGSDEEKTRFLNESNFLDLYIYDNLYPKTTGYIELGSSLNRSAGSWGVQDSSWAKVTNADFIRITGGPNTASSGMPTGEIHTTFTSSNYYDTDIYGTAGTLDFGRVGSRESNLQCDLESKGVTVEFWMKKNADSLAGFPSFAGGTGETLANSGKEVIFDLWNSHATSSLNAETNGAYQPNPDYGRLLIFFSGSTISDLGAGPLRAHVAGPPIDATGVVAGTKVADIDLFEGVSTVTTSSVADGNWHHYAFSFRTKQISNPVGALQPNLHVISYMDGIKLREQTFNQATIASVTGSLKAHIGALITAPSGNAYALAIDEITTNLRGQAALSASLDEFRYWKCERTEKEIQQNYFTTVNGGTNTNIANAELGVYYKFNEGITGDTATDRIVLDYSGRISNGVWNNYQGSTTRNTGSAIVSSSAATFEKEDPIIYGSHPDVKTLFDELSLSGSIYDNENNSSIVDLIPAWMVEEDELQGTQQIKKLTQIIGSYFDTLNAQIKALPDLKDNTYISSSSKPTPFMRNLLSSRGLMVPEIFVDATLLELFANRSETENYKLDINEVKNLIYKNIYNNLSHIYKSKGTEKSFRNLMHCYGIGDDIVRFNAYSNNTTFKLEDTHRQTVVRKNYVDFNHPTRFDGTVYMQSASNSDDDPSNFLNRVTGSTGVPAYTFEAEVIFPKKVEFSNPEYFDTPFLSSSLFGYQANVTTRTDEYDTRLGKGLGMRVFAVRPSVDSKDAKFVVIGGTSSTPDAGFFILETKTYSNVYDNQKWNFAIRNIKTGFDEGLAYSAGGGGGQEFVDVSGSAGAGTSGTGNKVEFVGFNVEAGVLKNKFFETTVGHNIQSNFHFGSKRFFIGADRTDLTGSVRHFADTKISSLKYYSTDVSDSAILAHALDPENVGTLHPLKQAIPPYGTEVIFSEDQTHIPFDPTPVPSFVRLPSLDTLFFHWDYSQVTGSNASGEFVVLDATSGSFHDGFQTANRRMQRDVFKVYYNGNGRAIGTKMQYCGRGFFPNARNSNDVISKEYVQAFKQNLPEAVNTADAVNVLSRDDDLYPRDAAISQTYFAFEKSVYGIVSQEILKFFATIVDFNDLIGDVVHKYRTNNKSMRFARELFFDKIQNDPDLDKFIDYYKWIDSSLSIFLQQLVPASADVTDEIRNVIEDHILTRSKYRHKMPMLDTKTFDGLPVGTVKAGNKFGGTYLKSSMKGVEELNYNWRYGHHPIGKNESHDLYWRERALRSETILGTHHSVDVIRQKINDIVLSFNSASADELNSNGTATGIYDGSTYALRKFARTTKLTADISSDIGGGYNYPRNQKPDAVFPLLNPANGAAFRLKPSPVADIREEEIRPVIKQTKRAIPAIYDTLTDLPPAIRGAKNLSPVTFFSSSASPSAGFGTHVFVKDENVHPEANAYLTNNDVIPDNQEIAGFHNDSYGPDYEVPMQGPFTNQHVGGNRHRHTDLNEGSDAGGPSGRAEAFRFNRNNARTTFGPGDMDEFGFIPFSNRSTRPNYRRDETAKRPVNIKNIQHRTSSAKQNTIAAGNFDKRYEFVQTTSRTVNNAAFTKAEGERNNFTISVAGADEVGYIDHVTDYAKPERRRTEHVIVSRFSAPGSPETAGDNRGGPGLDFEAAEVSPYNNLNYRNTTVRDPLRSLLTEKSERFGLKSGSSDSDVDVTSDYELNVTASFHKINRNRLRRIELQSTLTNANPALTASTFDNFFVQHPIPRSDFQYAWITGSLQTTVQPVLGYFPQDGLVSTGTGLISAINFVTASDFGAGLTDGSRRSDHENDTYDAGSLVRTDFAGLNTTIIEPISASNFTIGYPLTADVYNYYNYGDIGSFALNTVNMGSFIQRIGAPPSDKQPDILPNLIQHRQGPYGYPTWKQIRVGQGQLARYYRKNNLYTHTLTNPPEITVKVNGGTQQVRGKFGTTLLVSQSAVTSKFMPLIYDVKYKAGRRKDGTVVIRDGIIKTSFGNQIVTIEDETLLNALNLKYEPGDLSYKQILKMYRDGGTQDPSSPIQKVNSLTYKEIIFPSSKNMYTSEVRKRNNFENDFWRDSRADRTLKGIAKKPRNPAGVSVNQSSWALDPLVKFETRGDNNLPPVEQTGSHNDPERRAGVLQNDYVHFHRQSDGDASSANSVTVAGLGPLYARKQSFAATASVIAPWGLDVTADVNSFSHIGLAKAAGVTDGSSDQAFSVDGFFTGEAAFDANRMAGKFTGSAATPEFKFIERQPFYDTYDEFSDDIRVKYKDHSIIPEFRITDFLKFYRNKGDFLAENPRFLQIVGVDSGSNVPQNSDENNFFTTFTNSDFMKYFEVVRSDHENMAEPDSLTLKCSAVKKFIPYDGFYPAERTVQISEEFITSLSGTITHVTGANMNTPAGLRPLVQPVFAPGVLYNTIKSGLAVDYPILTGSLSGSGPNPAFYKQFYVAEETVVNAGSYGIFSNSQFTAAETIQGGGSFRSDHELGWDFRVPFESLIEPENYLANLNIQDEEPNPLAMVDSMINWSGQNTDVYKQMMNNFLSETVNFFMSDGGLTKIRSKTQKDFKAVTPGQPYGMRVKMWRSMDKSKIPSGSWGAFPLPQNTREILHKDGDINPYNGATASYASYPVDVSARETLTMYSRPSAFGPPIGLVGAAGVSGVADNLFGGTAAASTFAENHEFAPQNGVFSTHTPPYYDGECWYDIIFWPRGLKTTAINAAAVNGLNTFMVTFGQDPEAPNTPFQPTLDEMFSEPSPGLFFDISASTVGGSAASLKNGTPLAGSFRRKWRFDQEELLRHPKGSHWTRIEAMSGDGTSGDVVIGPAVGKYVNKWSMQLDASVNIFRKSSESEGNTGLDQDRAWEIQTKFECPILDFGYINNLSAFPTTTDSGPANATIPLGMWHQFGRLPQGDEGVYLQVTDIPEMWLANHPSASLIDDLPGINNTGLVSRSPYISGNRQGRIAAMQKYYNGYSVPVKSNNDTSAIGVADAGRNYSNVDGDDSVRIPKIQSLIDVCGFSTEPQRVGELRDTKQMSEGIVAVPFIEDQGERKFFRIMGPTNPNYETLAGASVKRQVDLMSKYVMPPFFDFLNNPGQVAPVAMYIFDFTHTFTKNDLQHMWQNLAPELTVKFDRAQESVTHRLYDNELLGSLTRLTDAATKTPNNVIVKRTVMPEKLQWMVFKVKQRAFSDYLQFTDNRERTMPKYTSNWPYDFCSMIELAKIGAEVEFRSSGKDRSFDLPPPAAPGQEPPNVDPPVHERPPFLGEPSTGPQGETNTAGIQDTTLNLGAGAGGLSAQQGVNTSSDMITSNLLTGGRIGGSGNTGMLQGGTTVSDQDTTTPAGTGRGALTTGAETP